MQTNGTIVLVLTIFSVMTSYADVDWKNPETRNAQLYAKMPWALVFAANALVAWDASSAHYWSSLEGLFIASIAVVGAYNSARTILVTLASGFTLNHPVAAYIGVRTLQQLLCAAARARPDRFS